MTGTASSLISRPRTIAITTLLLAALTACTPDQPQTVAPEEDWTTTHEMLWQVDETLLGDPAIAGDTVLAYVDTGDLHEAIVAWDLKSGDELWRRRTLTGWSSQLSEANVALLSSQKRWQASVVLPRDPDAPADDPGIVAILDARTGADLAPRLADEGLNARRPYVCGDGADRFCVDAVLDGQYDSRFQVRQYSVEAPSLTVARDDDTEHETDNWDLGSHVSYADGDLIYDEHGKRHWRRSYEEIFGEKAVPAAGWVWNDDVDADADAPLIGWGATDDDGENVDGVPRTSEDPLGGDRVVRLDRDSGDTVWSQDAGECLFLESGLRVYDGIIPLCRYLAGSITTAWDGSEVTDVRYEDIEQEILGVHVDTGDVVWRREIGSGGAENRGTGAAVEYPHVGDLMIVPDRDGTLLRIDVSNGKATHVKSSQTVFCRQDYALTHLDSGPEPSRLYFLAKALGLCDAQGDFVEHALPTTAALEAVGYDTDEISVVNTPDGLVAYAAR